MIDLIRKRSYRKLQVLLVRTIMVREESEVPRNHATKPYCRLSSGRSLPVAECIDLIPHRHTPSGKREGGETANSKRSVLEYSNPDQWLTRDKEEVRRLENSPE